MNKQLTAIIIDDELSARRIIREMLEPYSDWIIISAEAGTCEEAIQQINRLLPDLVFLDIELPDGIGFEVLEQVIHQPQVVFTTANDQYAIKAFESFSLDYLLKPIR